MAAPAASLLQNFDTLRSPNRVLHRSPAPLRRLALASPPSLPSSSSASSLSHGGSLGLERSSLSTRRKIGIRVGGLVSRGSRIVPFAAASEESKHSDIELEKENKNANVNSEALEKAWSEALDYFKAETLKVKAMSGEVYEVYSKKAIEILMDTSGKLKIQADKAQHGLTIMSEEVAEEGKEYLFSAARNSPDSVKDIMVAYASIDEQKNLSAVRDFHLGLPYGCFLAVCGFLDFMFTGSIAAIRFGVILGTAILGLSASSLRSWKDGKATPLLLKAQTAIAAIIFLRQLSFQRGFPSLVMLLISGAMLAFYIYRNIVDRGYKGVKTGQSSES